MLTQLIDSMNQSTKASPTSRMEASKLLWNIEQQTDSLIKECLIIELYFFVKENF